MENWKSVKGYDGLYEVSDLGNIRSLDRVVIRSDGRTRKLKGIELAGTIQNHGYKTVSLSKKGVQIKTYVHHIVAIAFLNHKVSKEKHIDHINNIRIDNRLSNIQIITHRENTSKRTITYSSKYVGVVLDRKKTGRKKCYSRIQINGKQIRLGYFSNEYEAHLAYQKKLKNI